MPKEEACAHQDRMDLCDASFNVSRYILNFVRGTSENTNIYFGPVGHPPFPDTVHGGPEPGPESVDRWALQPNRRTSPPRDGLEARIWVAGLASEHPTGLGTAVQQRKPRDPPPRRRVLDRLGPVKKRQRTTEGKMLPSTHTVRWTKERCVSTYQLSVLVSAKSGKVSRNGGSLALALSLERTSPLSLHMIGADAVDGSQGARWRQCSHVQEARVESQGQYLGGVGVKGE